MRTIIFCALALCAAPAAWAAEEDHGHEEEAERLTLETAPVQSGVELACTFATECFESEECAASGFAATLAGRAGGMSKTEMVVEAVLISDAADVVMLGALADGTLSLSGGPFSARHMLTITGRDARYTVHYADGPLMISYLGECR